jgi:predicted nucleic acid-binding protein
MSDALLIDTDILIDYLRDYPPAVDWLEALMVDLNLSAINVAEIYSGMRDSERRKIETLLECFTIIPLDAALAETGGLLRRDFGKSHGTQHISAAMNAAIIGQETVVERLLIVFLADGHVLIWFPSSASRVSRAHHSQSTWINRSTLQRTIAVSIRSLLSLRPSWEVC